MNYFYCKGCGFKVSDEIWSPTADYCPSCDPHLTALDRFFLYQSLPSPVLPRTPDAARKEIEWLKKKREAAKGESLFSFVERGLTSLVKVDDNDAYDKDFEPRPYTCEFDIIKKPKPTA